MNMNILPNYLCRCLHIWISSLKQLDIAHFYSGKWKNPTFSTINNYLNSILKFGRPGLHVFLAILYYCHFHILMLFSGLHHLLIHLFIHLNQINLRNWLYYFLFDLWKGCKWTEMPILCKMNFLVFLMLGIKVGTSGMPSKHSSIELHP